MSFEEIPSAFENVRVAPHSLPAEQGVLGCILLSPKECTSICLDKLKGGSESFYSLSHQTIYEVLVQMHDGRKPVDFITLQQHLKDLGKLDEVGGLVYLSELMNATPSSANLEYYLGILDEKWKARKLIEIAGEAVAKAYNSEGEEIDQTIDRLASWAVKTGMAAAQGERVIKEVLMGLVYQFDQERKGIFADIIPTGLTDYDRRFRGLVLQELCILAGRPSTGKTASALQVALNVLRAGTPVGIVSLEMTAESLLRRMAGAAAGLEMQSVQHFSDNQMVKLTAAMMRIKEMPLSIHDQAGLTVRQIQSIVRGWVQKNKVKVVIIDYLQLVVGSSKRGKDDRTLEVAEISLALKQLAKELNVAMLVLAQLNREVEKRGGRPRLSDLKECLSEKHSFLWTDKGVQRNLDSNMSNYSLNNGEISLHDSSNVPRGEREVLKIRLSSGRELICTPNHRILTDVGWVEAKDLSRDHAIAAVRKIHQPSDAQRMPHARWLGRMLGNGCMSRKASPSFICSCKTVAEDFCKDHEILFGFQPKQIQRHRANVWQYALTNSNVRTSSGNPVTNWFKDAGIWGLLAPDKTIPDWFLEEANDYSIAELIAGLFETDGSIQMGQRIVASYSSTSQQMANQVVWCLSRLGIFSRIDTGYKSKVAKHTCYKVVIDDKRELESFAKCVNLIGIKGDKLRSIKFHKTRNNHGDRLGVWVGGVIRKVAREKGLSHTDCGYRVQGKRISVEDMTAVIERIEKMSGPDKRLEKLKKLAVKDIYWDRLKSKSNHGKEVVFDRNVPDTGNFVCNGIVVHNCGAIEQDADSVILLWYGKEEEEETKESLMKQIDQPKKDKPVITFTVAKKRNGATGDVSMIFEKNTQRFLPMTNDFSESYATHPQ